MTSATRTMSAWQAAFSRSIQDPEAFWAEAGAGIHWYKNWDQVLDKSRAPFYRWFTGGQLNTCYNALDRHVENGRANQTALIYDSPVTNQTKTFTYRELRDTVARFAGALAQQGVGKGDRVVIYMPMVPEAAVAMLACARLGAVHSVVFGGFASRELAVRIDDAKPKVVVSASCGIEGKRILPYKPLLDEALRLAHHKPDKTIILQRPMEHAELVAGRDLDWHEAVAAAKPHDCVPVAATDPLYILYTSGTTGQAKGVVRDNGGHAVALNWTMKNVYGLDPGDVFWTASDVGWVVGHSYIVYGPLLHGNTTVLYEGKPVGTPDAGAFWRVIAQHKVKTMFTAPTAFRAIKKEDPALDLKKKYDLSNFKALFLAGERCDPDTLNWAVNNLHVPVIDHWWQTETGWAICANCLGIEQLPVKPGSPTKPVPGMDVRVVNDRNEEAKRGDVGALVIKLPLPPGTFPTLWNNDEVNVAGHRLSTGGIEEVLSSHQDVAECAVFGVNDELKGQVPFGLLVLKSGVTRDSGAIVGEVVQMVRDAIGPVASFKTAVVIQRLPKTRSGKILRGTMQKIANGDMYATPATIDDPAILAEIEAALANVGYAKKHA